MRRPGTPTPVLVGDTPAGKAITVSTGRREVPFELDQLTAVGGRIRGELTLSIGQLIRITLTDKAGTAHEIDAEVVNVRMAQLLNDEADVRFLNVPDAVRAYLDELVRASEEAGQDFDQDNEQPTQRRSSPLLPNLDDLDPPTLRKDRKK